jgi:LPXTG-motif cell wall-anchored protein
MEENVINTLIIIGSLLVIGFLVWLLIKKSKKQKKSA